MSKPWTNDYNDIAYKGDTILLVIDQHKHTPVEHIKGETWDKTRARNEAALASVSSANKAFTDRIVDALNKMEDFGDARD